MFELPLSFDIYTPTKFSFTGQVSKTTCGFSQRAMQALQAAGCAAPAVLDIDRLPRAEMMEIQEAMGRELGSRTVPQVSFFISGLGLVLRRLFTRLLVFIARLSHTPLSSGSL